MDNPIKQVAILHEIPKHPGVDIVLRVVEVDGEGFLDIRDRVDGEDYVWGRGYLIPLLAVEEVSEALAHFVATGQPTPVVA